ncbi:MAG: DUF177 domain-containing protein [Betaproteobacteria bacterium]|nr:DUF177 domain-containing protein [Betaproteobacteria bacterium]
MAVASLTRLQDCLFDTGGTVDFRLKGGRDGRGRPVLILEVNGLLHLQCQRCLGLLEYPLHLSNTLTLLKRGENPGAEAEDPNASDFIEASSELDMAALVEDEILLSLPLVPRHPDERCQSVLSTRQHDGAGPHAFSKLAALKKI